MTETGPIQPEETTGLISEGIMNILKTDLNSELESILKHAERIINGRKKLIELYPELAEATETWQTRLIVDSAGLNGELTNTRVEIIGPDKESEGGRRILVGEISSLDLPNIGVKRGITLHEYHGQEEYAASLYATHPEYWQKLEPETSELHLLRELAVYGSMKAISRGADKFTQNLEQFISFIDPAPTQAPDLAKS